MLKIEKVKAEGETLEQARSLLTEYTTELNANLDFQNIADELENPMTKYGPPRGSLLVAFYGGQPAGCVGLRPVAEAAACEMKRLYVRPAFRQFSIGRALTLAILEEGRSLGYKKMKLDSLERLQTAILLYKKLGFTFTQPYNESPLQGVVYMEKDI